MCTITFILSQSLKINFCKTVGLDRRHMLDIDMYSNIYPCQYCNIVHIPLIRIIR